MDDAVNDKQLVEKELLLRISAGDELAFSVFFREYSKLLYSFLYRHTDDIPLADDLVQDIFARLWQTRETLANVDNIKSYLFVLARNHTINIIKKRIQENKRNVEWQQSIEQAGSVEEKEQFLDLIDRAVEQLPEQQRKTWIMSRRKGMKYVEIAEELGISRETVKTYLQYANAGISKYVLAHADLAALIVLLRIF